MEEINLKINRRKKKNISSSEQEKENTNKIEILEQVTHFKYLRSTTTHNGRSDIEIKLRIAIAKQAFS